MKHAINPEHHLQNRNWMVAALAGEIFGPDSRSTDIKKYYLEATEIRPIEGFVFDSWDEFQLKRHVQFGTREEILKDEAPSKRYGVGLLFPQEPDAPEERVGEPTEDDAATEATSGIVNLDGEESDLSKQERSIASTIKKSQGRYKLSASGGDDDEADTLAGEDSDLDPLRLARLRRPRSMGITFVADSALGDFRIAVDCARYRRLVVKVKGKEGRAAAERVLWLRVPLKGEQILDVSSSGQRQKHSLTLISSDLAGQTKIDCRLDVRSRPLPAAVLADEKIPRSARLVTVTLVNDSKSTSRLSDELTLFQCRFSVSAVAGLPAFLPLPKSQRASDPEEESLSLLYRKVKCFANGHGCAGDWTARESASLAESVVAEPLPLQETSPVTPDLVYPPEHAKAGQTLSISLLPLVKGELGYLEPLKELADLYEAWIEQLRTEVPTLSHELQGTARRHLTSAETCLGRILKGLNLIQTDSEAGLAFRLANEAILLQQLAGRFDLRRIEYDKGRQKIVWPEGFVSPSLGHAKASSCTWRPFQIAFLLMSVSDLWDGNDPDREIADLIWFPTGGGKTEAYLGASAFYIVSRRLQDPDETGTAVLMRYTLRLLTSQQFQRAAGLICALESIRTRDTKALGNNPFGIGIWVGGSTTPNSNKLSVDAYNDACKEGPEKYQHVMLRCPWCASQMGPVKNPSNYGNKYVCLGLTPEGRGAGRVIRIHCPDAKCSFHARLPVLVVDEEIYATPPSLIIGTVDKFAMLAWKPEARAIFGIGDNGTHEVPPPGLIIQDELHLITGPLGSMVGLYEGVIEELCTYRPNKSQVIKPKLIASTATTRASTRQIADLYARPLTAVFPPPGLDAGDSFFANYDRDVNGVIKPGRLYVGILARAYGSSLTVNVRVFSALLAACNLVPNEERDPWQTLLVFHNSLRELGSGLTLFGADIPERLAELRNRWVPGGKRRYLNEVLELTGRLSNSDVPRALEALERALPDKKTVDGCLASNIIEVGVDVPRLGLMAVSGQPKNTAQYIQATGRVGRAFPGLVIMVYDNRKARDLSHYEQFKDYHGRLYAAVEPASVTPFTPQVLERALHGAFIAWVRNRVPRSQQDDPRKFAAPQGPMQLSLKEFFAHFKRRIEFLFRNDARGQTDALNFFTRTMNRRSDEWLAWTRGGGGPCAVQWSNNQMTGDSGDQPLLRRYGEACKEAWEPYTWPTPTSMRGVDAECSADIFHHLQTAADLAPESEGMFG